MPLIFYYLCHRTEAAVVMPVNPCAFPEQSQIVSVVFESGHADWPFWPALDRSECGANSDFSSLYSMVVQRRTTKIVTDVTTNKQAKTSELVTLV
jgi:hypothetical protein